MRFIIAGSSGFLGTQLREALLVRNHEVIRLVRSPGSSDAAVWDPYSGAVPMDQIEQADVVVNLAGSPTAGNPHSTTWANELEHSRVSTTRTLAQAIADSDRKPTFLAGNGISYYGDRSDEVLDETADSRGNALLTRVTRAWQAAAQPAQDAGARLVIVRTAPVLDRRSAPLKQLALLFKLGLGGPLGNGSQYFPVIGTTDWVHSMIWCAEHELHGPVNFCVPTVPTNAEFTAALATKVHRPAVLRVPAPVIKFAAAAMAREVLGSVRAVPKALLDSGFTFAAPTITEVLDSAL